MFEIVTYASFVAVLILFNYIDYRMYRTIINPFFFLSVPFSVVLAVCLLFNESLGFIPFYSPSLWVWSIGLVLFWMGGHLITLSNRWVLKKNIIAVSHGYTVHVIFVLCMIFMGLKLMTTGGELVVGSKELGEEVSIGGVVGRIANILMIAFPFYAYYRGNKYIKRVALLFLFIFLITLGSKIWMMSTVLSAIIVLVITKRFNINIRLLIFTVLLLLALFSLYYYLAIRENIDDPNRIIEFISRHFYFYFTSGILPMGEYVKLHDFGVDTSYVHPIIGVIKSWRGETLIEHSTTWITTDLLLGTQSNVFTFFGTLYKGCTIYLFIFYSMLYGLWCYFVYEVYRIYNNVYLCIATAFNLSILFFGWFNCGFGLLRIWEISILLFILYYINHFNRRINCKI